MRRGERIDDRPVSARALLLALAAVCGCATGRRQLVEPVVPVVEVVRRPVDQESPIRPAAWQTESDGDGTPFELVFPDEDEGRSKEPADREPEVADEPDIELPPPVSDEPSDEVSATPVVDLAARAVARSPRVAAARHRAAAAAQEVAQARSFDDPRLGTTYAPIDSNSLQTAGGRIPLSLTLSQRMPWRDKLEARAGVAAEEARRLSVLASEAELAVALEVHLAAADLWYADAAIEIARSDRELLASLEDVAKARVRSGGSQQDVLSARLEADRLENRIASLRRLRGLAVTRLAALLGEPPTVTDGLRIDLPVAEESGEVEQLIKAAVASRPELRSHLFAVRRDRHRRRLACLERYPDFDVGLGWQSVTRDEAISPVANGHDNLNLLVGVTLPVRHARIDAGIREADQAIFAGSREYDAGVDDVRRDVLSAVVRLETLGEQLRLHEATLLPRSEQVLKISLADYRGGKVSFVQVTQNALAVLSLRTEAARLRAERAKAAAELRRAVGQRP